MDKVTVKVMSHSCKMADITDQDVSCKPFNLCCIAEDMLLCFNLWHKVWCIALCEVSHITMSFTNLKTNRMKVFIKPLFFSK